MGIDVLIPVLARPQNVLPTLESLSVTEHPHRVFFICSPGDRTQIAACRKSGAETLVVDWKPDGGDFAKKINWAFERTDSEWVFQGADDLRFHAGWDTAVLEAALRYGKRVIGTNDLHNPQVKRKLQSTHTLFARSYIEEKGGTLDGSGRVFCELYDHQFTDTEFCEVAKKRGEWAFCSEAVVEHLHPHWGLAEDDETYRKAIRATSQDYRLFMKRVGRTPRLVRLEERRRRLEAMRGR